MVMVIRVMPISVETFMHKAEEATRDSNDTSNRKRNDKDIGRAIILIVVVRPGFHIIIRSLKTIADSLQQSASVSRLTCFHIVIRNR